MSGDKPAGKGNRERWAEVVKLTGKCQYCPKHDRENRCRRPRSDRGKNPRR